MAATILIAQTPEIALAAATAKTVLAIVTAQHQRVKILRWGVFFDGTSPTSEPVQVILARITGTAGTFTSGVPSLYDPEIALTPRTVFRFNYSVEPGSVDPPLDVAEVHPQQGYEYTWTVGQEPIVGPESTVGIRCTAPNAVNVRAKIVFEE